jgi:hypothetical protein
MSARKTWEKRVAKKTKKVTAPRKPLTYKFVTLRGGRVAIRGLDDDERVPQMLDDVLMHYGFVAEGCGDYIDGILPTGDDFVESEIGYIAEIVPVHINVTAKDYRAKHPKMVYSVALDECDPVDGRDLYIAMHNAHKAWNKAGRTVEGVSLATALDDVLNILNEERKGN